MEYIQCSCGHVVLHSWDVVLLVPTQLRLAAGSSVSSGSHEHSKEAARQKHDKNKS